MVYDVTSIKMEKETSLNGRPTKINGYHTVGKKIDDFIALDKQGSK